MVCFKVKLKSFNPVKFATSTAVCIDWLMGLWLIEVSAYEMANHLQN
jgi:hypothetical protein